jgi:uncharacterized protein
MKALLLTILAILILLAGTNLFLAVSVEKTVILPERQIATINLTYQPSKKVELKVPAVDQEGNGVVTVLKVEARPGEGRILTDIHELLFWVDTQYSIRIAREVAERVTKMNTSNLDIIYSIETEGVRVIGGESAGAALTIATIAAIQNKTVRKDVGITGTIQEDGSIGPVGGVLAKGRALNQSGIKLFLVPSGQGTYKEYEPVIECKEYKLPGFYRKVCTSEYKEKFIDISKEVGIEVKEVKNIEESLKYFFD